MSIAYFDCFGGASGDMIVGALLDAGVRLEELRSQLSRLPFAGYSLSLERVRRGGLAGMKFHVELTEDEHHHHHEGGAGHEDEPHAEHDHHEPHHHHGRNLKDIFALLDQAKLPDRVDTRARMIFRRLGEAEARVHNVSIDEIHFHEVGAIDSIVDIVGACIGLEILGVDRVACSPIPLGSGTVKCDHGLMPVPAPATAELMRDGAIAASDFPKELCTPTGAAILTTLAESFGPLPAMDVRTIGYGAGGRDDPGRSNLLRVFVGEAAADGSADTVVELSANIDDAPGQLLGAVQEMLLAGGALDAWATPIYMKKSRPAWQLSVLCEPADVERMQDILFRETTTIGIRRHTCSRSKLTRRHETVETPYGPVRVKVSLAGETECTAMPEFADCLAAAQAHHVPVKEVQASAIEWYRKGKLKE